MGKVVWMIKWVLVLILVWTIGWAVSVSRQAGAPLGPTAALGLDASTAAQPSVPPAPIPVQATAVDYAAVLSHDPFADATAPGPAQVRSEVNDPCSVSIGDVLGVALIGTVSGSPQVARAIIRDARTQVTMVHKAGDRVGDATLEAISRDAVVFLYEGHREVLRRSDGRTPPLPRAQGSNGPPGDSKPAPAAAAKSLPPGRVQPGPDTVRQLWEKATVSPVMVDGRMKGLQVTGLDQIPGAGQLGLEEGDVICAVNGQGLTDPRKAFQVFKKARSQEGLQMELLRKGQTKTLSFDLR